MPEAEGQSILTSRIASNESGVPAICVRNLSITVKDGDSVKELLSAVSFDVPRGRFIGIIGSSGCGKSTLLRALAGFLNPSRGGIVLAGTSLETLKTEFPLAIGYLPQFGDFHQELTVAENLSYAASLRLPPSVTESRKQDWLRHLITFGRIGTFLTQRYRSLSGGQRRRMALTEELIGDPAFLFLDELTSGLDALADQEMMLWLRELAHLKAKTVMLVTHATNHLEYCDALLLLHAGKLMYFGPYHDLLEAHGVESLTKVFALYEQQSSELPSASMVLTREPPEPQPLNSQKPPSGWIQFPVLLARQAKLFSRDTGQMMLHAVLIVTFPLLVAIFATEGLPTIAKRSLDLPTNGLELLKEQFQFATVSINSATLVSGLAMFQVILLTLAGANSGAREIAKEDAILTKELRVGLSPPAYICSKFVQLVVLSALQAISMAIVVKTLCHFPGNGFQQMVILFMTSLAMSTICLAISSASKSPERASLLAIYLVGFQLPLSGAVLALPQWLATACRPFIAAYWGWSGYLQTLAGTPYLDVVSQSTSTTIAGYQLAIWMLTIQTLIALLAAGFFVAGKRHRQET